MTWRADWRERTWEPQQVAELYRRMVRSRKFEEEGKERYIRGDFIGPYHSSVGQEAVSAGAMMALSGPHDYMTSTHRSHGHQIAKGASLPGLAAEIWGKSTGVCKGKGGSMHVADFSVGSLGASALLGGGMAIAAGAALAQKLGETGGVVGCFFGDGAVNEGIFHETLNWASAWNLPVVFLCENNQYAVTMWYRHVTSVDVISKRAVAYGMPGVTVDGQNVLEAFDASEMAVDRARTGGGPTLIEFMTYRYEEHSLRMVLPKGRAGAREIPDPYRSHSEVERWEQMDPITLLRASSLANDLGLDAVFAEIDAAESVNARDAWEFAEKSPWPNVEEIWADTWPNPVAEVDRVALS